MLRRTVPSPSPDQLAAVSAHRDRWCRIGLSTEPARRAAAESAIADLYLAAGLPRGPRVVWCASPMSVALARAAALEPGDASEPVLALPSSVIREARAAIAVTGRGARALLGRPVSSNVWDGDRDARRVRHTSWWHLRNELPVAGTEELRTQLVDRVRAAVWDAVWSQILPCAWNHLLEAAEGAFEDLPRQAETWAREVLRDLSAELISMHEQLGVLAALDFMREVCGAELLPAGHAALELARSAGWAVGYEGACWVSERPSQVKLDGQGRLHCSDGPALVFRDGWSLFFWHGARVPSRWIEQREQLSPRLALSWPNVEERRVLAEIIGWERVLAQLPSRVVDQDPDPAIGTLLECQAPGMGRSRFLRVRCATGRTFVLCVPAECATARQANAWTYGLEGEGYALEVRT